MHVLVAGLSARAAAASAARAGFTVTALDAFDDLDRHPSVRGFSLPRDFGVAFSAPAAARVARDIACDAVVYLSNFENHPAAVRTLSAGRRLLGNPPDVLRRVRDPLLLTHTLKRRGFHVPAVRTNDPDENEKNENDPNDPNDPNDWLLKPFRSGGGHGVRQWPPNATMPRGCYLQERIDGVAGSIVFVAAGGRAVPLGMTRQLIGESACGADGYRYCGNILAAAGDPRCADDETLVNSASALVNAIAEEFDLVGLNGVDFIAHGSVPYAIEVNPRWCSSMELVETAHGLSLLRLHVDACTDGVLPEFDSRTIRRALGKAIVFARQDVVIGDTCEWLDDSTVRDVPHPGEQIAAGRPVCTVFASGHTAAACHAGLVRRAGRVYAELARWNKLFGGGTALHHERGPHDQTGPADQRGER